MANQGAVDHVYGGAVSDTVTNISNLPTYIALLYVGNTTGAVAYLQVFWKAAASVTLGTTAPDMAFMVPASGGAVIPFPGEGWKTRGANMSIAGTTTRTGNTAAVLDVNIFKKL